MARLVLWLLLALRLVHEGVVLPVLCLRQDEASYAVEWKHEWI